MSCNHIQSNGCQLLQLDIIPRLNFYILEANNPFSILWCIAKYPSVKYWENFPWPSTSLVKTTLLVLRMLKAKCLDHPSYVSPSHLDKSKFSTTIHGFNFN